MEFYGVKMLYRSRDALLSPQAGMKHWASAIRPCGDEINHRRPRFEAGKNQGYRDFHAAKGSNRA